VEWENKKAICNNVMFGKSNPSLIILATLILAMS